MKYRTRLIAACVALALAGAASAAITVTGETTSLPWDLSMNVVVGTNGVGTLTVDGGSSLESNWSTLGLDDGDGTATITGTGSSWTTYHALRMGNGSGSPFGSLTIDSGAVVNALYYTSIGQTVNSSGMLTVDNATLDTTANYLLVGNLGSGTMYVQNGGVVNVTGFGNIARGTGGSGFAQVSGIGSAWNLTGNLEVGRLGAGTLRIKDDGLVKIGGTLSIPYSDAHIAMETGGQLALADGAGTGDDSLANFLTLVGGTDDIRYWNGIAWDNITNAIEGVDYALSDGTGDLAGYAVLAVSAGSPSGAVVFGKTTALPWGSSTNVIIGNGGVGTLMVDGGSGLESQWSTVGAYAGGYGVATITGTGSSWTTTKALRMGYNSGRGSMTVSDGAVVTSLYYTAIAFGLDSVGTLTVDNATLNTTANYLHVGSSGRGAMIVKNGGLVNVTGTGDNAIGRNAGGTGYVRVVGTGSAWRMAGNLEIARFEDSSMRIEDSGLVAVGGTLGINAYQNATNAYIEIQTGGQLALADGAGTGDDSIANFLALVDGNDDIRYYNGLVWTNIAVGVEGIDYSLAEGVDDLSGYAVLTVSLPPPPEIGDISIMIDGANTIISWTGTNYATYALQSKESLVIDPTWSDEVAGIPGEDGIMSATTTATAVKSYYRIIGQ